MAYPPPPGGNQPGWDPNQQPPPQPGYQPQPGAGMPQPGAPGQPPQPPGGYAPPPGMPPGGYPPQPPPKNKSGLIVGCSLAAVLLIAGIVLAITQPWSDSDNGSGGTTQTDSDRGDDPNGGADTVATPEEIVLEFMDKSAELALTPGMVQNPEALIEELRPFLCTNSQDALDELAADLEEEDFGNAPGNDIDEIDLNVEFTILSSHIEGDIAVVEIEIAYTDPITNSDRVDTEEWELLMENGGWKLCDDF